MELSANLALWVHLICLALAGASAFGGPALFGLMAKGDAAQKPVFAMAIARLAALGRMALVLMILSGGYLFWAKYAEQGGLSGWFDLKMTLVLLLAVLAVFGIFNARKARAGDAAAAARMPTLSKVSGLLVVATVLSAVFAFN